MYAVIYLFIFKYKYLVPSTETIVSEIVKFDSWFILRLILHIETACQTKQAHLRPNFDLGNLWWPFANTFIDKMVNQLIRRKH